MQLIQSMQEFLFFLPLMDWLCIWYFIFIQRIYCLAGTVLVTDAVGEVGSSPFGFGSFERGGRVQTHVFLESGTALGSYGQEGQLVIVGIIVAIISIAACCLAWFLLFGNGNFSIVPLAVTFAVQSQLSRQLMNEFAFRIGQIGGHLHLFHVRIFSHIHQQFGKANAIVFRYGVRVGSLFSIPFRGTTGSMFGPQCPIRTPPPC
mmetsp:Transcript_287/g.483  ORF Transcript_287/g.483 Transcript_287/m.483 type:complete len:204 (-) Transcript_287:191-802(-)